MGEDRASDRVVGAGPGETGYLALTSGCAVGEAPSDSLLDLTGEDRVRFLNGQVTCEVKSLVPGRGAYGFCLDARGRILADAVISAYGDRLRLQLPPGSAETLAEQLGRYVVADRVELEIPEAGGALLLAGPESGEILRRVTVLADLPDGWDHLASSLEGTELLIRGELRLGVPAWRLEAGSSQGAVREALREAGAVVASARAFDRVRIEAGIPRCGVDFGPENFPQETGLEEWAVSYTKGCYIGQEVVARIHYRGKVNHRLCGLVGSGEAVPATGEELSDGSGRPSGRLTSAAYSPALDRPIGLAILHRRAAEPGTELATPDGDRLVVGTLPFVERSAAES